MTGIQLDTIHVGDALTVLRTLPDGCVNCIDGIPYTLFSLMGVASD